MEDTLRVFLNQEAFSIFVLILVLMEDTLRDLSEFNMSEDAGLNPCFNGRYSQSYVCRDAEVKTFSLNPCFNGRYSQSWLVTVSIGLMLS